MQLQELYFQRPQTLQATVPPETRGLARDQVRLMISNPDGHRHTHFHRLADYLRPGDLLVVNRSATLPASLSAIAALGNFRLNLSTNYGKGLWLAEPRWSADRPGPLPLQAGETIAVAGMQARMVAPYPGTSRLWFVQTDPDLCLMLNRVGTPIRYGYVASDHGLDYYQTIFSRVPGSAEMPSAGRPFTPRVLARLKAQGVRVAGLVLHTGVSSLEVESEQVEDHALYAEPFNVPTATARLVNATRAAGGRIIAVGTTVVRALESAWEHNQVQATQGYTRLYVHPRQGVNVIDGLITGLHDPFASHLAMLFAIAGKQIIQSGYAEAVSRGYLWHEFGDSHLILPN